MMNSITGYFSFFSLTRRLSAFGCVFCPLSKNTGTLFCVYGGLWFLRRCFGREREAPLDGPSQIWLFRYGRQVSTVF